MPGLASLAALPPPAEPPYMPPAARGVLLVQLSDSTDPNSPGSTVASELSLTRGGGGKEGARLRGRESPRDGSYGKLRDFCRGIRASQRAATLAPGRIPGPRLRCSGAARFFPLRFRQPVWNRQVGLADPVLLCTAGPSEGSSAERNWSNKLRRRELATPARPRPQQCAF